MLSGLASLIDKQDQIDVELLSYYFISVLHVDVFNNEFAVIQNIKSMFEKLFGKVLSTKQFVFFLSLLHTLYSGNASYDVVFALFEKMKSLTIDDIHSFVQCSLVLTQKVTISFPCMLSSESIDYSAAIDTICNSNCEVFRIMMHDMTTVVLCSLHGELHQRIEQTTSTSSFINSFSMKPSTSFSLNHATDIRSFLFKKDCSDLSSSSLFLQTIFPLDSSVGLSCLVSLFYLHYV